MKKQTKLQEFVETNYGGNYKKLAIEINDWHKSEVFKIYRDHGAKSCMIAIWAKGSKKPRQMRWAWLLLVKFIWLKFELRVNDGWLVPYDVDCPETENHAPELFTEDETRQLDDFAKENAKLALHSYTDALDMIIEGLCRLKSLITI